MPLIIGEDRLIPGFEANLVGLKPGDVDRVRHHLPRRLPGGDARRPAGPLQGRPQGAAREDPPGRGRRVRAEHGRLRGPRRAQGATSTTRLGRNALDRARHEFADKIIEYAVANATIELPDVLVDQEVEVMHDEFRVDARPPGHRRGGVPQGDRPDRGGPPRRVPAARRAAHQGPARAVEDRRRARASTSPTRRRGAGRARPRSATRTRRRSATSSPSAAATSSASRSAGPGSSRRSSTAGSRPIPTIRPLPHLEDDAPSARRRRRRPRPTPPIDATDPGAIPGTDHDRHHHDHDHDRDRGDAGDEDAVKAPAKGGSARASR